jgi:hypothetical protein
MKIEQSTQLKGKAQSITNKKEKELTKDIIKLMKKIIKNENQT